MTKKRVTLDYSPRQWQADCHKAFKRFNVVVLHRRAGKTELAMMELVDRALRNTLAMPFYAYLAPELKQAKIICWARLKQKVMPLVKTGAVIIHEGELMVTFQHNGAVIRLFGADNPDSMRGVRLDGIVLDEVAQVKPVVWDEIVQPALADRQGWAVFIGTPKGINLFSELYYSAQVKPDWHTALWTVHDTDALPEHEVERLRASMSEEAFAREFLCDFTASGTDQLISLMDAEAAGQRLYTEADMGDAPRVLGVDPARFGDDRSVIMPRQGLQAFEPIVFTGIDNMQLAARVASKIEEWKPHAVFIDAGAGAGVIDRLRQMNYDVIEVPFGGKASKPNLYLNRRCEMWFDMRDWIVSGGAIVNDNKLKQEIATPTYKFDNQQRHVLESKDEIKKRLSGAGSPDLADALALTFASPVVRLSPIEEVAARYQSEGGGEYDPYASV